MHKFRPRLTAANDTEQLKLKMEMEGIQFDKDLRAAILKVCGKPTFTIAITEEQRKLIRIELGREEDNGI